jgi:hypothetical protein
MKYGADGASNFQSSAKRTGVSAAAGVAAAAAAASMTRIVGMEWTSRAVVDVARS